MRYGSFVLGRGIRKGDPLSSYLFILCAESLSCLLDDLVKKNRIQGFKVARITPSVSHLFFANDCLSFFRAKKDDCEAVLEALNCFE